MMKKSVWRTSGHGYVLFILETDGTLTRSAPITEVVNGDRDDDVHPPQLKDTQDRPGGIHVHLRSMVVRWVGSSTKMEQDAPAASGESATWFLITLQNLFLISQK